MTKESLLEVFRAYFAEAGIALANRDTGCVLDGINESYILSDLAEIAHDAAPQRWDEEITREIPVATLKQALQAAEAA